MNKIFNDGCRHVIALVLCIVMPVLASAQLKDTLSMIKNLIDIGKACQQKPSFVQMELVNSTNYVTSEDDTSRSTINFYVTDKATYIDYGDIEQVVNDSFALLVSKKLQRMILYADAAPMLAYMRQVGGFPMQDSSARRIAEKYTVEQVSMDSRKAVYQLSAKRKLHGTELSVENLELQYDPQTKAPVQVITVKRTLVPLEEEDYRKLLNQPLAQGKLVNVEDKSFFLIREQTTSFLYRKISHAPDLRTPVTIADRVTRNSEGSFEPVKDFNMYAITVNR